MTDTETNIIESELQRIQDEQGRITPEIVVISAEKPESPLHHLFEWDDSVAGHKYRIEQAREVIRSIRLTVTYETKVVCVPAYVRDPSVGPSEQGYVTITTLASEKGRARSAVKYEFGQAKSALVRAENIAEYLKVRKQVSAIREMVVEATEQIEQLIDEQD